MDRLPRGGPGARVITVLILMRALAFYGCGIAALLFSIAVHAESSVSEIKYRYDADRSLTFEDIVTAVENGAANSSFDSADIPVGDGNHWVFLSIKRLDVTEHKDWRLEIGFPNIDRFEALVKYENGSTEAFQAGDEVAFQKWPIDYRKPSIPLWQIGEQDAVVVFRVQTETPLIFPLKLLTAAQQSAAQRTENFLYGAFYGAIFMLALYNGGIYFSLRDRSYRFYILYILSFSIVQASTTGLGQQYLWPALDNTTTRLALFAIILTNYFMVRFVIDFLDLKSHSPAFFTPLRWLARSVLCLSPLLLLPWYAYTQYAVHVINIVCMILIVITTVSMLKKNRAPAIYLLASYSVLFSAIVLALMFQANLIQHYAYIDYSMSVAILVEAVILSVGLSERITLLRIEREEGERQGRIVQEELSQQLIQTREHERAEISQILHGSINHDLVVVRNRLGKLFLPVVSGASDVDQEREAIDRERKTIDELLNKTISDIRDISHFTHPQIVRHLGLETALRALFESTFDASVSWDLHVEKTPLDYDTELFLYRAGQELTTNIIKHANASECLVRLSCDRAQHQIVFILKDDGDGFGASGKNWRFGLRTLNEHCKSVSGDFSIESIPGEGTSVTITLPLSGREQTA